MKILVARHLDVEVANSGLGNFVIYRPELASAPGVKLRSAILENRPNALLLGNGGINEETIIHWREAVGGGPLAIVGCRSLSEEWAARYGIESYETPQSETAARADLAALGQAEAHLTRLHAMPHLRSAGLAEAPLSEGQSRRRVILVGAGIVNLITAWELTNAGYEATILDASSDPRTFPDWRRLGATHGGGNARMFSLTEADNYNDKGSLIYSGMSVVFRQRISEGGWLARDPNDLTQAELRWVDWFHSVPAWLAEVFTRDIFDINRESMALWEAMRSDSPSLFKDVGYVQDILRVYAEPEAYEAAVSLQSRVGAVKRVLRGNEVAMRHPAFTRACESGEVIGGLDAVGFTLNIHDFVARLLRCLEERGTRFRWGVKVKCAATAEDGLITGLRTSAGFERADHYVISPGAYGHECLTGTRSEGKVQGIFGLWLTLPNIDPMLRHSVKLHREGHVGEDSNITLARDEQGRPILLLGSGYGFLGNGSFDLDSPEVAVLFDALEETARRYLPDNYDKALADDSLRRSRKACVRPFTPTGLGIFEVVGTADGGRMVITTGHNTGGFTQAPSVAKAVVATLDGALHPMQEKYDPDRGLWP